LAGGAEARAVRFWCIRDNFPRRPIIAAVDNEKELAILFADVVGSTRLFDQLGDVAARDKITICVELMREATEQHGGTVVKTMGDEILATFPGCNPAMEAALKMQSAIGGHAELSIDGQQIAIRIGCHFGPVVQETRDVFGAAVHTANRMTSQAKAGQILVTDAVHARLSGEWRAIARQVEVAVPRGQQGEVGVYEMLWQHGETTSMLPAIATISEERQPFRIRLRYLGQEIVLDNRERPAVTVGRGQENDLVIKGNLVSRLHARIEAGKNRFQLVDESTNGSFLQGRDGQEAFVRRDSVPLKGTGLIGFGRVPEAESWHTIEFVCEDGEP
jgi:class 3 adenylate cyclase